ncbi:hypothetical protein CMO88_03505 [Candidatus Woesearchaeota archaeon]|nr:hypothetical protein [Candidatus Woesearchaeota archaeon]|tara:strand:+ start:3854 stop:4333 length:480 start_codon:yes stop_codon:yes gene_type:complete
MNKKGEVIGRETLLAVFGVLIAVGAVLGMAMSAKDALDKEALFKNYLARDLALAIDALYAAPGEATYIYSLMAKHTFFVSVDGANGLVKVSEDSGFADKDTFSYRFATDKNVNFIFEDKYKDEKLPEFENLVKVPMKVQVMKRYPGGKPEINVVYFRFP